MDLFPKYIIEDNNLILSKVGLHKELVTNDDLVKGGGWFRMNNDTKTFTFHGESFQYGRASLEDVKMCIEADKVFTNKHRTHSIANDFKFVYDTQSELIPLN